MLPAANKSLRIKDENKILKCSEKRTKNNNNST